MNNFGYSRAADIGDAVRQIAANTSAKFIAGGTNLLDLMKENVTRPSCVIDITHLPLQRVHLSCQHTSATIQHEKVTRAVLAALHREKDREHDQTPPNNSFHQGYRLPQRPRCNRTRLQTVDGTARIFGN